MFRPSQDLSVRLGSTSREQLMSQKIAFQKCDGFVKAFRMKVLRSVSYDGLLT